MYQTQSVGVLMNTIGKLSIPLIIETLYISANYFKTLITQALETNHSLLKLIIDWSYGTKYSNTSRLT